MHQDGTSSIMRGIHEMKQMTKSGSTRRQAMVRPLLVLKMENFPLFFHVRLVWVLGATLEHNHPSHQPIFLLLCRQPHRKATKLFLLGHARPIFVTFDLAVF